MDAITAYIPCTDRDISLCAGLLESISYYNLRPSIFRNIVIMPDRVRSGKNILAALSKEYNVAIFDPSTISDPFLRSIYGGWGYSKILPFFLSLTKKFVVLDSDTSFLSKPSGEILVAASRQDVLVDLNPGRDPNYFYDAANARLLGRYNFTSIPSPTFFLSGYLWGTRDIIPLRMLRQAIEMQRREPSFMYPGDQGILNLCLNELNAKSMISLAAMPLQILSEELEKLACSIHSFHRGDFSLSKACQIALSRQVMSGVHLIHYEGPWKPYFWSRKRFVDGSLNFFRLRSYKRIKRHVCFSCIAAMAYDDFLPFWKIAVKYLSASPCAYTNVLRFLTGSTIGSFTGSATSSPFGGSNQ